MKEKERPEPRIERGTSRRYAWVISLSENHTTRPPGLLLYLPIQIKLHRIICVTSHVNYNLITVASKNFSPARICLDYKYIANQHRNVVSVGARVTSSVSACPKIDRYWLCSHCNLQHSAPHAALEK